MDEMDPTLTVLEHAKEAAAQQKYLYALKDSVTNVEFTAHLIALQQQQSTMSAVDDSCLQQGCLEKDQKESTASTPSTARRRQRIALARFVKKIKRRAEEKDSARAEASRVLHKTSGADINPAAEGWRTWNSSETSGSADLIDLPTWLDQRRDRAEEYEGLGYTNTVSSFAASRHWERRAQRSEEAEYQQLTNSERRSQQRTRRAFQPEEAKEDCFTVFKAFDGTRARKAMMNYKSGIKPDKKVKFKRGDSPAMKTMLNELAAALPKSKVISGERHFDEPNGAEETYKGPLSTARSSDVPEPTRAGTEEAYLGPLPSTRGNESTSTTPRSRHVERSSDGDRRGREPRDGHDQEDLSPSPPSPEVLPARQIGGRRETRSVDQLEIPERRAAIGSPQDMTGEELDFLKTALEVNLPMVMQQRNPKRDHSVSRHRYEKYKSGKTLREVKGLGAKWDDVVWDYARGYIDFNPTMASNANLVELVDQWENRGIESSPAAYVNSEGIVNTSSPCSFLSFEENIQQDYAQMAVEHIESLTHRAQRVLQRGLGNQTLEQFAHCCASRIMVPEPLTVKEAMASEHAAEWKKAMQVEIDMLTRFNTFKVVTRDDALKHDKLVKSKSSRPSCTRTTTRPSL